MTIFPLDGMTGVTIAREPGRLLVSSSPPFPSGAEGQVIALAERGLEDLADLGVEAVEEVREGDAGSRAEDVCDRVLGLGRL